MKLSNFLLSISFVPFALFAEENTEQLSETLGHMIGQNLLRLDVKFDMPRLIKGIQEASLEKDPPMTEKECIQALQSAQKKKFQEQGIENLKAAEKLLANHAKQENVISLESGKVLYRILQEGSGMQLEDHSTPFVRYAMKNLDGSTLGPEELEEPLSLDETIPGLKAGMIGMKEGERRIIYIHPDLAYGATGFFLIPPNLLLIFEMELLKANF
ncbi:MAG: FKBP-type peptidyl-prolyl cis-trans isomerase N-terminal domain-containing protein [Chlamydiales bacterium]|nr:FKBP-type peptidyl-prolyl cis-trans isomerase N-terminal domain-containing protein [Chlamydiales bacterium]